MVAATDCLDTTLAHRVQNLGRVKQKGPSNLVGTSQIKCTYGHDVGYPYFVPNTTTNLGLYLFLIVS